MAKVKYCAKENKNLGTHSFYAVPVFNGKLSFAELCEEACDDNSFSVEEMQGCVSKFMKIVQREVARGFRCEVGNNFLTVYPNLSISVKDYTDKKTGELVVATADMVKANNAKARLSCTVNPKYSAKFAQEVSWMKVDAAGSIVEEEDATQGNENVEGGTDNTQNTNTGGNTSGGGSNDEPGGDDH